MRNTKPHKPYREIVENGNYCAVIIGDNPLRPKPHYVVFLSFDGDDVGKPQHFNSVIAAKKCADKFVTSKE